jgi:hypothetical protein
VTSACIMQNTGQAKIEKTILVYLNRMTLYCSKHTCCLPTLLSVAPG